MISVALQKRLRPILNSFQVTGKNQLQPDQESMDDATVMSRDNKSLNKSDRCAGALS